MNSDPPRPWFRVKRYGFGWEPATWQALVLICAYVGVLLVAFTVLVGAAAILVTVVATAAVLLVSWWKGEREQPLKWRWGRRNGEL